MFLGVDPGTAKWGGTFYNPETRELRVTQNAFGPDIARGVSAWVYAHAEFLAKTKAVRIEDNRKNPKLPFTVQCMGPQLEAVILASYPDIQIEYVHASTVRAHYNYGSAGSLGKRKGYEASKERSLKLLADAKVLTPEQIATMYLKFGNSYDGLESIIYAMYAAETYEPFEPKGVPFTTRKVDVSAGAQLKRRKLIK